MPSARCVGRNRSCHCPFGGESPHSHPGSHPRPPRPALSPPRPWPLPRNPRGTPLHPVLPSTRRLGLLGPPRLLTAPRSRMGTSVPARPPPTLSSPTSAPHPLSLLLLSVHCAPAGREPCGSDPWRPGWELQAPPFLGALKESVSPTGGLGWGVVLGQLSLNQWHLSPSYSDPSPSFFFPLCLSLYLSIYFLHRCRPLTSQ